MKENNSFFKWKKLGKLVEPSAQSNPYWISEFAQAPNTLVFPGFVRVFFCSRAPIDQNGQYTSRVGYADIEISDRISILRFSTEPILSLGGIGEFDQFGTYPFSPLRVKNETIAVYAGWTRCESTPFDVSLGFAVGNPEATKFERFSKGPILTKSLSEPYVISSPKLRFYDGKYFLFYIAGKKWIRNQEKNDPIYTIRMATSLDGTSWVKENREIISSVLEDEAQASPDVFYKDGVYHMFFCYRYGTDFREPDRGYRMGYAYSRDLFNWIRDDSCSMLEKSHSGWDSESVSYPHIFEYNSEIYMLYLGNHVGKEGIGIARLETHED